MSTFVGYPFRLALAGLLLTAEPSMAAEGVQGNLVDVRWLEKRLGSSDVLILDASPAKAYAEKHIPGAVGVSPVVVNMPFALLDLPDAEIEKLYRSTGIAYGKKIVMYDQGGNHGATRLFFSLYYHGLPAEDLFVLDGGLSKWQAEGLPVTKDSTPPPKSDSFEIRTRNEGARAGLPEVLTASGDPDRHALIDALDPAWHFGQTSPFHRGGHIPNGILLPSADFFHADKTFKSPEEVSRMLAYFGIRPEQKIYAFCGGGIAASVPFFAAKFIARYPEVKLFPGSELEWLSDARELPFWTYDVPSLMRDAKWLQFWGGQMLRTYLGSSVSIVDVRPAAEFDLGHAPFALNVPAETFRSGSGDPAKLAEILGRAGVDAAHEAVVVSGGGLTPDAALAFAMLEKLGQRKVSVLMDSLDEWAPSGLAATKDATAVGPKKSPNDLSIPPTKYSATPRPGVIVLDPLGPGGASPKVFVASGKNVPAKAPEGRVVHVPYTDLLDSDGKPKAAKDIWSVLAKAGVPRYAELVCFADDPGEAAANYFALTLMGFPDVKVWMKP